MVWRRKILVGLGVRLLVLGWGAPVSALVTDPHEPLGPSSRTTGLVLSEILVDPLPGGVTNNLEFIELYNTEPVARDIGNHRLSGEIDYTFPPGTSIAAGSFLVVAADPAALESAHPGLTGVLGPPDPK